MASELNVSAQRIVGMGYWPDAISHPKRIVSLAVFLISAGSAEPLGGEVVALIGGQMLATAPPKLGVVEKGNWVKVHIHPVSTLQAGHVLTMTTLSPSIASFIAPK